MNIFFMIFMSFMVNIIWPKKQTVSWVITNREI